MRVLSAGLAGLAGLAMLGSGLAAVVLGLVCAGLLAVRRLLAACGIELGADDGDPLRRRHPHR